MFFGILVAPIPGWGGNSDQGRRLRDHSTTDELGVGKARLSMLVKVLLGSVRCVYLQACQMRLVLMAEIAICGSSRFRAPNSSCAENVPDSLKGIH